MENGSATELRGSPEDALGESEKLLALRIYIGVITALPHVVRPRNYFADHDSELAIQDLPHLFIKFLMGVGNEKLSAKDTLE
jgi:hypothetical protein